MEGGCRNAVQTRSARAATQVPCTDIREHGYIETTLSQAAPAGRALHSVLTAEQITLACSCAFDATPCTFVGAFVTPYSSTHVDDILTQNVCMSITSIIDKLPNVNMSITYIIDIHA